MGLFVFLLQMAPDILEADWKKKAGGAPMKGHTGESREFRSLVPHRPISTQAPWHFFDLHILL